jgi:TRAP-type C4-dicarboxylate transport system substrate-binding protein
MDIPLVYVVGTMVINQKAFSKLSEKDQQTVKKVMGDVFAELNLINRKDNEKAKEALKNQGIKFTALSQDEEAPWRKLGEQASKKMHAQLAPEVRKIISDGLKGYRTKH